MGFGCKRPVIFLWDGRELVGLVGGGEGHEMAFEGGATQKSAKKRGIERKWEKLLL